MTERMPDEPGEPKRDDDVIRIKSEDLFGSRRKIHIEHAGALYTLRITNKGKLLLTK